MPEPIRLVIWDFAADLWDKPPRGIDTEWTPLSLVRPLAGRGIVSAVCSPQGDAIRSRLEQTEIASLVLYADDAMTAKDMAQGERIAVLLRALRLPPAHALVISGSGLALREALHVQPGLQFADDDIIAGLLDDRRLQGRDDPDRLRLTLFRRLLARHEAERQDPGFAGGLDRPAFLRSCDMHVRFDYDVAAQAELALELIRDAPAFSVPGQELPDDPEQARAALVELLDRPTTFAALVRLRDRFADWGAVGVYVISQRGLRHFAFSPQVAASRVDTWVYDVLGRPRLLAKKAVAERVTPGEATADWIIPDDSLGSDAASGRPAPWIPLIRLRGGWDMEAVAHFLRPVAGAMAIERNVNSKTALQVRVDHSSLLRLALEPPDSEALAALAPLGFPPKDFTTGLFEAAPPGSAIVLGIAADAEVPLYRHQTLGITLPISIAGVGSKDLTALDPDAVPAKARERAAPALEYLRANFVCTGLVSAEETEATLARAFARVPEGCTLFLLLAGNRRTGPEGTSVGRKAQRALNESIRRAAASHPSVILLDPSAIIPGEDPAAGSGANSAPRAAFYRAASALIAQKLGQERPPPAPPAPEPEPEVHPEVLSETHAQQPPSAAVPPRRRSLLARILRRP